MKENSNPSFVKNHQLPKEVWIGWISSMAEAYNMSIYSFIAPLLAPLLFKNSSAWSAVIFSYSLVLLGSCLLYPAGAIYYGLIGDREGRQKLCIYSTLGLGLATGFMGLVPLQQSDNMAWIFFLLLIAAQHFFSGGEYHGSIVFSLEHGEQKKGGFMSSLSCLFAVFGIASANGLATVALLTQNFVWMRLCFILGGIGGIVSYLLKYYCRETPAFKRLQPESIEDSSLLSFIKLEWQKILKVILVLAFFSVSYSYIFIFLPLIPFEQSSTYSFDTFTSLIAYGVFLIVAGWIADRIGLEKTLLIGFGLFSAALIPLSLFCTNLFAFQMTLIPCACLVIGPIHSWMLQQFDIQRRCRGIFISAALTSSLFGGSTVPICLMVYEYSQSLTLCSMYPLFLCLCAATGMLLKQPSAIVLHYLWILRFNHL